MTNSKRKNWNKYFIDIAFEVSKRATCDRKHVGAIIVKDKRILATGYNGSMYNDDHCDDEGHLLQEGHCIRTVHAEVNAIAQAAKYGVSINNSNIYITCSPCFNCLKVIINSGIKSIFYKDDYGDIMTKYFSKNLNIHMEKIT